VIILINGIVTRHHIHLLLYEVTAIFHIRPQCPHGVVEDSDATRD